MHSSNSIFLIKPANFGYNAETATSNAFQNKIENSRELAQKAIEEFEAMALKLSLKGVNALVLEDSKFPIKPDAVFPNNWGSFHADGTVVLYPMLAKNRRAEKRRELLEQINEKFKIKKVIDLSEKENKGVFLEGTGSIIFDHTYKIAYACLAPRTDKNLFVEICELLRYRPVFFHAHDRSGKAIYHTNVMMNIGNGYAVICMDSIHDEKEKQLILQELQNSDKEIVDISFEQMNAFCGNMIELKTQDKKNILAMSQTAFDNLSSLQKDILEKYCELLPLKIHTIEKIGGGSVRCMISEIFLPQRTEGSENTK